MPLTEGQAGADAAGVRTRRAERELRRSRRYLRTLLAGLTGQDVVRRGRGAVAESILWHVGRLALDERRLVVAVVDGLRTDVPVRDVPFMAAPLQVERADLPPWEDVLDSLASVRKLTVALLREAASPAMLEVVREVVNAEYSHARHVRQRRRELGLPDVSEPRGALVAVDTDCDVPPRFFVPAWEPPRPRAGAASAGEVVSLEGQRRRRAAASLERGHGLVAAGDHRGALRAFEDSARLFSTADALTYQGWMHSLFGDLARAERLCLAAIELDPDFGNPYNDIGTICLQRRDITTAIQWFEHAKRAKRYEPRHFPFVNLGRLYITLGMPEKALREFESALPLAPANQEICAAIENLRNELSAREG